MAGPGSDDGRDESPLQRADRNWNELTQELRVTQTGTQILTAFLLTLPFQPRFAELTTGQIVLYLLLVVLSVLTTTLMVAPVSIHRFLFGQGRKIELVRVASRLTAAALVTPAGTALIGASSGRFAVVPVKDLRRQARTTKGTRPLALEEDDRVTALAVVIG